MSHRARRGSPPALLGPGPEPWPYLTSAVAPVAGAIKRANEDFVVEELPLYEPEGTGDHVFFGIEKVGLSTMHAVADIARELGVRPRDVGLAGLKDTRAVTRQTLSVEHVDPARIESLELPRIRVLWTRRHPRKLRTGHLAGNRFTIRLREVGPVRLDDARLDDARRVLDTLGRRGVPNYFGRQRFGSRGDTAEIGRRLIRGEVDGAVALIAGAPGPTDTGPVLAARERFAAGEFREAAGLWPRAYGAHARLSRAMAREKGNALRAIRALDRRLIRLYVNAYQSWLFNAVLAERIDGIDRVLAGDLAVKHDSGGIFRVGDAEGERPRVAAFEISATGPLPGPRMREPEGEAAAIERRVLSAAGVAPDDFADRGPFRATGARRALRFRIDGASITTGRDEAGAYFELRFTLPPGCYATAVLREVGKTRLDAGPDSDGDG